MILANIEQSGISQLARGFLSVWMFVLSLATVSPDVHDWMHGHADCNALQCHSVGVSEGEQHVCGVTMLDTGAHSPSAAIHLLFQSTLEYLPSESVLDLEGKEPNSYTHSRAPPETC